MKRYRVACIGFPQIMALDLAGPMDVFATANAQWTMRHGDPDPVYRVSVYSIDGRPFEASNGLCMTPKGAYRDITPADDCILLLAGGIGVGPVVSNASFIEWLRTQAGGFQRVLSICSASFLLAHAGLLSGKSATTHWQVCELMKTMFPDIQVNDNAIYVRNDNIYTSAGVSTGIDLALAIVMEDLGRDIAMEVAQQLVLYLHRPGGQRQFSPIIELQRNAGASFCDVVVWMAENLREPLDVDVLAQRACMSPRHFSRRFRQETGLSPMRFLNQMRLEKSRTLLEQGTMAIQTVARECGFQNAETFRRQFNERYGLSPMHYQGRF